MVHMPRRKKIAQKKPSGRYVDFFASPRILEGLERAARELERKRAQVIRDALLEWLTDKRYLNREGLA